jgi:hypothetical protein
MEPRTGTGVGRPPLPNGTLQAEDPRAQLWDQVTAVAGLVFAGLVLATLLTPATPSSRRSPAVMATKLTEDLTGHQWSLFFTFLTFVAFFVLLAGLWSRLRRWEGEGGLFSGLFVVAGTAFLSVFLVSEGIYLALVEAPAVGARLVALPALTVLNDWVAVAILPAGAAMFLGAAGAIVSTHALPVWLGWFSGVLSVLLLVSIAGVFETSEDGTGFLGIVAFASFLLILVWTISVSIVLLQHAGRTPARAL